MNRTDLGFGAQLDQRRRELGLSWDALASRSKVSRTYLQDLAAGRRGNVWPSEPVVAKVATALGVEPDYFLLTRARVVLAEPVTIDAAYKRAVSVRRLREKASNGRAA